MKRIVTAAAIVMVTALAGFSQTQATGSGVSPCTLNVSQAPAIRGLRLGMKTGDVLRLFPGTADQADIKTVLSRIDDYPHFGVFTFGVRPSDYPGKERFAGIEVINFVFLDGQIAEFDVQYSPPPNGAVWHKVDDFINKIADTLDLPHADSWTTDKDFPYARRSLKCDGFQLQASNLNSQGQLRLVTADTPSKTQRERLAAFEEKGRREFKP